MTSRERRATAPRTDRYDVDRQLPPPPPEPREPLRPRWVSGERLVGQDDRWASFFFVESDFERVVQDVRP